jgi:hypothetical protein
MSRKSLISTGTCQKEDNRVLVLGGTMRLTEVMTIANKMTNLGSYSGPTLSAAISERHLSVTFRYSGASKNCKIPVRLRYALARHKHVPD